MTSTSSSCLQPFSTPVLPSAPILTQVRVIDVTHSSDLPCCCVNILFGPVPHRQHGGSRMLRAGSHVWLGMCLESAECVCCQSEGGARLRWTLWASWRGPQARVMERPGANMAGVRRAGGRPQGYVRNIEMTSVGPQQSARSEVIDPPHAPFLPPLHEFQASRFWLRRNSGDMGMFGRSG